jgi:hypothetical protein
MMDLSSGKMYSSIDRNVVANAHVFRGVIRTVNLLPSSLQQFQIQYSYSPPFISYNLPCYPCSDGDILRWGREHAAEVKRAIVRRRRMSARNGRARGSAGVNEAFGFGNKVERADARKPRERWQDCVRCGVGACSQAGASGGVALVSTA